jgi:hypothetical protein
MTRPVGPVTCPDRRWVLGGFPRAKEETNISMKKLFTVLSAALLGTVMCGGCGSGQTDVRSLVRKYNNTHGKRLANLYGQFQAEWGRGPKDEKELKRFIAAKSPAALEEMGVTVDVVDELFSSERDKQPFFVRYGLKQPRSGSQAIVFETQGVGGKALVVFSGPLEVQVPLAELESYKRGEKDPSPE